MSNILKSIEILNNRKKNNLHKYPDIILDLTNIRESLKLNNARQGTLLEELPTLSLDLKKHYGTHILNLLNRNVDTLDNFTISIDIENYGGIYLNYELEERIERVEIQQFMNMVKMLIDNKSDLSYKEDYKVNIFQNVKYINIKSFNDIISKNRDSIQMEMLITKWTQN